MLEIQNADCGYICRKKRHKKLVIRDISFTLDDGEILCILGKNGIGKTTLFKSILGSLKLHGGRVLIDGDDVTKLSRSQIAKVIGYVPQSHVPAFPFSVLDIVVMGRTAHLSMASSPSAADTKIALCALETLGISHLREQVYTEISGGERQLVLIARALTQEAKLLIMDEPTSNLDFGNQIRVLRQIDLLAKRGIGIILTSHYPNHAFLCSTKVLVMKGSGDYIVGTAEEVITEQLMKEIYGIDTQVVTIHSPLGMSIKSVVPFL